MYFFWGHGRSRAPDSYSKTHLRGLKGQFPPICDPFHGFKDLYRLSWILYFIFMLYSFLNRKATMKFNCKWHQSKIHIEMQISKTSSKYQSNLATITIWEHCEAWFECKRNVLLYTWIYNLNLKTRIFDWIKIVCSQYQMFFNLNHAFSCPI